MANPQAQNGHYYQQQPQQPPYQPNQQGFSNTQQQQPYQPQQPQQPNYQQSQGQGYQRTPQHFDFQQPAENQYQPNQQQQQFDQPNQQSSSGQVPSYNSQPPMQNGYHNGQPDYPPQQQQAGYQSHVPEPLQTQNLDSNPNHSQNSPMSPLKKPAKSPKIDPNQLPRCENKIQEHADVTPVFYTRSGNSPPPAASQYIAVDEGNASPRYVRLTCNQVATEQELVDKTRICVGAVLQPLANPGLDEEHVPIVDMGALGPVRCNRCHAYMNPFMHFASQGNEFTCNMCGFKNACPREYFSHLDANGIRRDAQDRMELCRGSVEYVAPDDYSDKPIQAPHHIFAIDVSRGSVVTGLLQTALDSIRRALPELRNNPSAKFGIITFDSAVHFYNLAGDEPKLLVVPDLSTLCCPLPVSQMCLSLADDDEVAKVEACLDMIETVFAHSQDDGCCLGAAAQLASEVLSVTGGKVIAICSNLVTGGASVGELKRREDHALLGTDKENTLFAPANDFFTTLAKQCVKDLVCVDLFACPHAYVDLATIGQLSNMTGGQLYYFEGFDAKKNGEAFANDLFHNLTRFTAWDGVMTVRCSTGLSVVDYYGNFHSERKNELILPCLDSDKTFAVRIEHDDKLQDKREACVQMALLYTTSQGQRRIRVHTVSVPTTSALGNLFRYADLDAIINLSVKQAVHHMTDTSIRTARQALVTACIDILFTYRKYCATASSAGQLILPESLKLLPLYTLGMIKSRVLADGVTPDERCFLFHYSTAMPPALSATFIYPRMYELHDLEETDCTPSEQGRLYWPPEQTLSGEKINSRGLYLIDTGRTLYVVCGHRAQASTVSQVFGLELADGQVLEPQALELMPPPEDADDQHLALKVSRLVDEIRYDKPMFQEVSVLVTPRANNQSQNGAYSSPNQDVSLDYAKFRSFLLEDEPVNVSQNDKKNPESMSYVDFLCHIHRRIQDKFL